MLYIFSNLVFHSWTRVIHSNNMDTNAHWFHHANTFVTTVDDTYPFISSVKPGSLSGKSVLITGASRGIGLQTALHFAKAGCSKIALAARSALTAAKEAVSQAASPSAQILTLALDVSSPESVRAAASQIQQAFGHLDILINNAGHLSPFQHIADSDPLAYLQTWQVNLNGTYLCTQAFLPLLLGAPSSMKTIINVSSAGANVVVPGASAYQVSKFALCRFTEFLDAEYAEQGLVAIAMNPGGVKTQLALEMPGYMMDFLVDTVELSADTIVWLARERREWLRGRFVTATWKMDELESKKEEIVERNLLKFRMAFE